MAEAKPVSHPSKPQSPKPRQNPSKPVSSFLYKVILASVLIALLPIFPYPQSPELSNKSILARSWELLHLLLVGIAISYGLFSRRNSDPTEIDKETQVKIDMPQSYVSQFLQVPTVFDDEEEVMSPKVLENQTWNYSQYYQKEPVVVVAEETTGGINSSSSTEPLFLPVRSLKYRPHYNGSSVASNEVGGKIGGEEAFVLPSPIPWRSRSERMEAKEESSPPHSPRCSASDTVFSSSRIPSFNSAVDAELCPSTTPSLRSSSPPAAAAAAAAPSPKRPPSSPSPSSDSPEIRGKISEDFGRKRSFNKSSPPLPPPPPPPSRSHHFTSEKRGAPKSFKDELTGKFLQSNGIARSARTVRSKQAQSRPRNQREKKDEFMERMIIPESDSESSDDDESELSAVPTTETAEPEEENEVDKKADEFIAKFREQIRLQRIASIKKSSGQRNTINSN